jgi:hypothetical protein
MTTSIVYDGPANVQEFSKADFAKEGVDASKVSFNRGEVTEVDDDVARLLLDGVGVFAGAKSVFREPKKGDEGYEGDEPDQNEQAGKAAPSNSSGALQEDTGAAAAPAGGGTAGTGGGTTGTTGTATPAT